jgi:hypothetical protein
VTSYGRPSLGVPFVLLVVALPAFLQMSFVGHDLFAIGCAMTTVTLGLYHQASRPSRWFFAWSLAAGVIATARVPLAAFVGALALLLMSKSPRLAARFAAIAGVTVAATHLLFFAWGNSLDLPYQPFHVFGRAGRAGALVLPIGLLLSAGVAALQWGRGFHQAADWLRLVWAIAGLPFVVVGLGELLGPTGMAWSIWEGKVYAGFGLPLLVAAIVLSEEPSHRGSPNLAGNAS